MANYNVGNIEVGVISKSSQALTELDKVKQKLVDIKNAQGRQSISAQTSASRTRAAYRSVTIELNELKKSFKALGDFSRATEGTYRGVATTLKDVKSSFNSLLNLGKLYVALNYLRRFANKLGQITNYASDYAEALNKFEVSFGELAEKNLKFIDDLSKAYGLSRLTLMEYTATFNNMLKALGNLDNETSARFSRTLTQMAIDYASLFNQSIDSSMKAFQSVLAGSVRPIRSASGFDVSETSIFSIYQELGGTKTMRQLNQLEKRLLRIIAIQRQMQATGAVGDYSRTIEYFSNQIRVFKEQIIELGSTWGRLILYHITPALQKINGLLMAINEVGRAVTQELVNKVPEAGEALASMGKESDNATESIEDLNKSLTQLGLDQLNILGSSSGVSGMFEIDPRIMDQVLDYQSNLSEMKMKAHEISKEILEWAGFTYDANGNLINVNDRIEEIKNGIKNAGEILLTIFAITTTFKVIDFVKTIVTLVSTLSLSLASTLNIMTIVVGAVQAILGFVDILINGFSWESYSKMLMGLLVIIGGIFLLVGSGPALIALIVGAVIALVTLIVAKWDWIVDNIFKPAGTFFKNLGIEIANFFIGVINGIIGIAETSINFILNGINKLLNSVEGVVEFFGGNLDIKDMSVSFKRIDKLEGGFGKDINYDTSAYTQDTSSAEAMATTDSNNVAMTNAILQSNQQIVNAINNKNTTVNLNGKKVSEEIFDDINDVSLRKGMV